MPPASPPETEIEAFRDAAAQREALAWTEAWRPCPDERTYEVTRIEGEIPREIHGTLYRNGPSQRVVPKQGYEALHFFDGNALLHAFRFDDGSVHYTGRYARDARFLYEQEHGAGGLGFANLPAESEELPGGYSPNTNVVWHGGKLLALVEADFPFELDPRTLESRGTHLLREEMLGMSTSAHPKIDGRTGQMLIHGYQPFEPYVQLYVVEPDGTCSLAEPVETPYPVMMHDIAITENHVALPLCPITWDLERGACLRDWLRWEPEKGLRFGVRERTAGSPLRWFEAPSPGFLFHLGNAYEKDGKLWMDACTYRDGGALLEQLAVYRSGRQVPGAGAHPVLYELDLESGACKETWLDDRGAEFPRRDDRLIGYENRFGYALMGEAGLLGPSASTIARYDRTGGASAYHDFGPLHYPGEPVFVPRAPDAAEDDGFVLSVVYDGGSGKSHLAVLDARNLAGEPLARAHLEHRVPLGFHGNFAAGVV